MFERYDESARRAIFYAAKEARAGSAYVEPEHLLLGVMRASEPAASSALELYGLEQELRAGRATSGQAAPSTADIPLANASKRIVAYAAEEAARLNSWEIHCGHLLLGILREAEERELQRRFDPNAPPDFPPPWRFSEAGRRSGWLRLPAGCSGHGLSLLYSGITRPGGP